MRANVCPGGGFPTLGWLNAGRVHTSLRALTAVPAVRNLGENPEKVFV